MKRIALAALAAFLLSTPMFAATEQGYRGDANQVVPVSSSTPLPVDITPGSVSSVPVNLVAGTITASMSAFVSPTGVATAAMVDSSGYTYVNVATGSLNTTSSFVDSTGVASSALLNSSGYVYVDAATGTVAIANGLAVETGLTYASNATVATNALTLLSDFASGTAVPFWITVQNIGTVNLHRQVAGASVSDDRAYIAPGDSMTWYVATNTPNCGFHATTTGADGSLGVEITK